MMPLLNKLLSSRKHSKNCPDSFLPLSIGIGTSDRNSLSFGVDQVRILLFRECERRGRKLLFDSVAVEKLSASSQKQSMKNNVEQKSETHTEVTDEFIYKHERVARDDVSLLSEMVFGSVAMTYRGPSFKVHEMDSPPCIMCTKVFSVPEYNSCKQSERHSDEGLGHSIIVDSNSSIGSMKILVSQSTLSHSFGSALSPELRKNSTCSSTGSGWDIDVLPPPGSSQSLESSGSSGIGSLTSLRRRWLRAVSTSLSRAESEDIFGGQNSADSLHDNHASDNHNRRQKTRLGLAMLIQLSQGHERKMQMRLLEHAALLEGMLDRLCCCCFEQRKCNGNGLVPRMHMASTRCAQWLLRLLMGAENMPVPLLWHELLLNSSTSIEERVNSLHSSLQRMCRLLDDIDTKLTNFFLSTVVTAVLTHHLGWVHTVLSTNDHQLVETLRKQYPCNPLWAQLGDLYGALGNPMRLAHTVIAGGTDKTDLINSILTFLSYFIRSGIVERRQEKRLSPQRDLQEAVSALEQWQKTRSSLRQGSPSPSQNSRDDCVTGSPCSPVFQRKTSIRRQEPNGDAVASLHKALRSKSVDGNASRLMRSGTVLENLDARAMNSIESKVDSSAKCGSFVDEVKSYSVSDACRDRDLSPVKIVVSDALASEFGESKESLCRTMPLPELERKLDSREPEEVYIEAKIASLRRLEETEFAARKLRSDGIDAGEYSMPMADLNGTAKVKEVLFMLGEAEDRTTAAKSRSQLGCTCSAQLSEGVLRKIIQRNFPESSKSIQRPCGTGSGGERLSGFCPKCSGARYSMSHGYEGSKLLLETPTNATEVLRTCGGSVGARGTRAQRSNSLEYLMEANNIVELPMPRVKRSGMREKKGPIVEVGFARSLLQRKVRNSSDGQVASSYDTGYTWGYVVQGLVKNKWGKSKDANHREDEDRENEDEWWRCIREEIGVAARFPAVDQPVAEALCILADLDTWQVGILSNTASPRQPPIPVGMSRLVANMLEAFSYLWRKYHSPSHCVEILESKLREMWLRSEALAELLMRADLCETSVATLTDALDLDAADVPLLLAVATTHSPQIAQRFGLTLA